jgi:hypothetical protein
MLCSLLEIGDDQMNQASTSSYGALLSAVSVACFIPVIASAARPAVTANSSSEFPNLIESSFLSGARSALRTTG